MLQSENNLIPKIFIHSVFIYFLSILTTSLGTLVDGIVIGATMSSSSVAAYGLTNPMNFIFALISSVLDSGSSALCAKALGKGRPDEARAIFSVTSVVGIGLSVLVMIIILIFAGQITTSLGPGKGTEMYVIAKSYLTFYVLSLPAISAMKFFSSIMQLDSDAKLTVFASAGMTAANIIGDLLCVYVFHTGLAQIALMTTISYYVGVAILCIHFFRKNIIFRIQLRGNNWKNIFEITFRGLPQGISRLTAYFRGWFINQALFAVSTVATAGFSVQSQLNFITNSVLMGIAQAFMMLVSMYNGEKNKTALVKIVRVASFYNAMITGALSLGIFFGAPQLVRVYLGSNYQAYGAGVVSLRWFAIGLIVQGFNILFADYLQAMGRVVLSNVCYVLEDVLYIFATITILSRRGNMEYIFICIALAHLLMFITIPIIIMIVNRRPIKHIGDLLMLKDDYGVDREDEFSLSVEDRAQVSFMSEWVWNFCKVKGADDRRTMALSLSAEELATNVIKHGFADGKNHILNVRVLKDEEDYTLVLRDDCGLFDIEERYSISEDDPTAGIGIRLVMKLAKDVSYTSALKLNNVVIQV